MVGRVIKEAIEGVTGQATNKAAARTVTPASVQELADNTPAAVAVSKVRAKITEDIRAPLRDAGLKPMANNDGGIDLYDFEGNKVSSFATAEDAIADVTKPKIRAYHGSPYEFDEFKSEAIGTGEGAQAYGHGLYAAEEVDVARGYRKSTRYHSVKREFQDVLADDAEFDEVAQAMADGSFSPDAADLLSKLEAEDWLGFDYPSQAIDAALSGKLANYDPSKDLIEAVEGTDLSGLYDSLTGSRATNLDYEKAAIVEQIGIDGDTLGVVQRQSAGDAYSDEAYRWFQETLEPEFKAPGALYEVDINASKDDMLNWDEPLSEQPKNIRDKLEAAGLYDPNATSKIAKLEAEASRLAKVREPKTNRIAEEKKWLDTKKEIDALEKLNPKSGRSLYYNLAPESTNPADASKAAEALGIKGIKYKDASSRGSAGGTSNFVIFDPKIIEIAKKYGIAVPAAAALLQNNEVQASSYKEDKSAGAPEFDMNDDDVTGDYMNYRESTQMTPAQMFRAQQGAKAKEQTVGEMASSAASAAGDVALDIGKGVVELPRALLGGFLEATAEAAEALESIIPLGGETMRIDAPESVTGNLVSGLTQFATGFMPALRAAKAVKLGVGAYPVAGAVADAFFFDPKEERLSNLVQEYPALENPVTEYLATSPDDSEAEGRFKNAIEGLGIGAAADGLIKGVKFYKARREAAADIEAETGKPIEDIQAEVEAAQSEAGVAQATAKADAALEGEYIPFEAKAEASSPDFQVGSTAAGAERAQNINLNNVETTEDVEMLIKGVAEADAIPINEARREVITNRETEKLAGDLGMTVGELLARRSGEAFNAEQVLAARKILLASGENLVGLAKKAKNGGDDDMALFQRAMSQHRAIQAQVSGLTAEAGRALQSFRILSKSGIEQERAIKEALDASGGIDRVRDIADKMSTLDDPNQLGKFVRDVQKAPTPDMVYEVWINSLLSSPTTHVVNAVSNAVVSMYSVGERKIASVISQTVGSGEIPTGESTAAMFGMVNGWRDGLRLGWQALKTGEPADALTKIESQGYKSVTSESLGVSGPLGRAADFVGEVVRTPGRFLTAGDELFKAVGYRTELYGLAYRQAAGEGLKGEALGARIAQIVENPPANLHMAAVDASRYQTFTAPLGEAGQSIQDFRNKVPGARVIMPFIRTPVNIMKYIAERTPLAPVMSHVRADIAAGGARADMAYARIATGSMIMAVSADYAAQGLITGQGPKDSSMRNILRDTGWQPYSIKFGDTYYAYNRLDPLGAFLGLSADISEIIGQTDSEVDGIDLASAAVASTVQNVASKTWLSGVMQFFDVMSSVSSDPEENNKQAKRWMARLSGTVVPSVVAQVERTMSPGLSATYGILDQIRSRIPGYSEGLPPRRNIFGEPIVLEGGLGPDIMSPIYTSSVKDSPVSEEIYRQKAEIRMPLKSINGVELSPEQYDKYILLYSGQDNTQMRDVTLKEALSDMFRESGYQNATEGRDGGKALIIRSVFDSYRKTAQAQMIKEDPTLQSDIESVQRKKVENLTGR